MRLLFTAAGRLMWDRLKIHYRDHFYSGTVFVMKVYNTGTRLNPPTSAAQLYLSIVFLHVVFVVKNIEYNLDCIARRLSRSIYCSWNQIVCKRKVWVQLEKKRMQRREEEQGRLTGMLLSEAVAR